MSMLVSCLTSRMQLHSHPSTGSLWQSSPLLLPGRHRHSLFFNRKFTAYGWRDDGNFSIFATGCREKNLKLDFCALLNAGCGITSKKQLGSAFASFCSKKDAPSPDDKDGLVGTSDELEQQLEQVLDGWQWRRTPTELTAYALLLAAVPIVPVLPRFQWTGAFYFLFLALWTVYVGSHRSLGKKKPQKLSLNQGLAVPVFCSASLFGFYCLLRFFPDLNLKALISAYLGIAGTVAVASNLVEPLQSLLPDGSRSVWRIEFPSWIIVDEGRPVHFTVTQADVVASVVAISVAFASKQAGAPFTLNNLMAVCIATELLQLLSLGSFTIAAVMLSGLLLYDVFWVFGSSYVFGDNVMLKVATSDAFDGPMKLIFPHWRANAVNDYAILGLGDVAAPGLLIALMLRFDRARSRRLSPPSDDDGQLEPEVGSTPDKTYFVTCIASYIFGLTLTVAVNSVSGAAQPALLYLVPSLLFGVFLVAAVRSEASLLLEYKDETLLSPVAVKPDDGLD